jgi:hypothetical protein
VNEGAHDAILKVMVIESMKKRLDFRDNDVDSAHNNKKSAWCGGRGERLRREEPGR